ncbi:MAG TPA: hypothetical protein VFN65_01295 [Solirubrobacteraceae bacterium]|nr:hypothetical protein [Solirubrobacteraceae bacterium]
MVATVALTFGTGPALAVAATTSHGGGPSSTAASHNQRAAHVPSHVVGPAGSLHKKARAYGLYCQNESRTHVAGTPGTPFSACVKAAAKTATKPATSPAKACSTESKTHVAGTPGTPFSACVKGAAQAIRQTI